LREKKAADGLQHKPTSMAAHGRVTHEKRKGWRGDATIQKREKRAGKGDKRSLPPRKLELTWRQKGRTKLCIVQTEELLGRKRGRKKKKVRRKKTRKATVEKEWRRPKTPPNPPPPKAHTKGKKKKKKKKKQPSVYQKKGQRKIKSPNQRQGIKLRKYRSRNFTRKGESGKSPSGKKRRKPRETKEVKSRFCGDAQ